MAKLTEKRPRFEEISDELGSQWESMVDDADKSLGQITIALPWQGSEVETVKRAAAHKGVTFTAYVTSVAFRQALTDLTESNDPLEIVNSGR